MKRINYFINYSPNEEIFFDWRIQALNMLEPSVLFYCQYPGLEKKKGLEFDDIAQELRFHLWKNLNSWHNKSSLRTWADRVLRNKLIDLSRTKRELLDSSLREYMTFVYIGDEEKENN